MLADSEANILLTDGNIMDILSSDAPYVPTSPITLESRAYTAFGDTEDFKNIIGLRYALLPYIYRSFVNAVKENRMYMSPLSFAFPNDDRARKIEDQLLVGESLMIAPVYKQNAEGRYVYLPEDMTMYRLRSVTDYDRTELKAGDHYIDVALNEVLVFVRKGKEIPFGEAAKNVDEVNFNEIQTILK